MFNTISEYFCQQPLQIRQLRQLGSEHISLKLEAHQILNSVQPVINFLDVHQRG